MGLAQTQPPPPSEPPGPAPAQQPQRTGGPSGALQQRLAPGLAGFTDEVLYGDVWRRPELSPRNRSLVLPAPTSDAARARAVNDQFAVVAPKFAQLTNDVVFETLWRRSDPGVRDRSLVTIAALGATGDDDQLDFHPRRDPE